MNKLLTSLLLSVTLMGGVQAQKKENYYVKHVEFPQGATLEQKVDMAARLVPTPQQYAWQQMELTAFLHFGINTFTRREWGDGKEDPALFNPSELDAEQWVRTLKEAGFKMVLLTAKHHDGFCLFDSKLTEYKSTNTRFGRDIVREFLEAFRAEGIAVGLYFSLLDWSHPDFPKYADRHHPMRGREEYSGEQIDFDNYLNFMHGQVKELVTGYGKLDLLWFDFSYDDMAKKLSSTAKAVDNALQRVRRKLRSANINGSES